MKSLSDMNHADKAFLLHQLFPNEIPALLDFAEQMALTLHEDTTWQTCWDSAYCSAADWLAKALIVAGRIQHYGEALHHQPVLFSEQLFAEPFDTYSVHCLLLMTTQRRHPNRHFLQTVQLLFYP